MKPLSAFDDRHTEFLFELADAARQRGLGDVARLCRACEVLLAGERDQILQLSDVHCDRCSTDINTVELDHLLPVTILSAGSENAIDVGSQSCARWHGLDCSDVSSLTGSSGGSAASAAGDPGQCATSRA